MAWRHKFTARRALAWAAGIALAGCAALPPSGVTDTPGAAQPGWTQQRFEWEGPVGPADDFHITNLHGDVRVRTTGRGQVRVTAQVQTFGAGQFDVRIDGEQGAEGVSVKTASADPRGRVDMTVLLPPGKQLVVFTGTGLAEIKYRGDVTAETTAGRIFIKTGGHVSATSGTGDIGVALSALTPQREAAIRTAGNIDAWFPTVANLELFTQGQGVDIRVPEAFIREQRDRPGVVVLGNGGARVDLVSTGGRVQVRPLPPG